MTHCAASREDREREHFNRVVRQAGDTSLKMPKTNIERYTAPPRHTPYALEFAFHLLGDLRGARVVELGCGDGLNTVILAALGASVIGVDVSEDSLALTAARARANIVSAKVRLIHASASQLPLGDGIADRVLCVAILHHVDVLAAALEIRRVLKPGGVAVFLEPLEGPFVTRLFKRMIPQSAGVSPDERPLTNADVLAVNRAVGLERRKREFGLTNRVIGRLGLRSRLLERISLRLDAWLLARVKVARHLASPFVWEAVKIAPDCQANQPAKAAARDTNGAHR